MRLVDDFLVCVILEEVFVGDYFLGGVFGWCFFLGHIVACVLWGEFLWPILWG